MNDEWSAKSFEAH
jgi:protein transport protein SEC13